MAERLDPSGFEVEAGAGVLRGESIGAGPPVILCHGLTAVRSWVVHGSKALARAGHEQISYDARGHGSSDPGGAAGYDYAALAEDLGTLAESRGGGPRPVLAGHSMGAHTIAAHALEHAERIAALVLICPAYMGTIDAETLTEWDELADALESDGVEGFVNVIAERQDPEWRERVTAITRRRILEHRDLGAIAQALREVPRSRPFETLSELEFLDLPVLVVATNDLADPGHPYAVAETWAQSIPAARLISEAEGDPPLAWQGGRLSREIAAFCAEPAVRERLEA